MTETTVETVKVLSKTTWTDTLFSFTVSRPDSCRFTAGQFVRLGVNPSKLKHYRHTNNSHTHDSQAHNNQSIDNQAIDNKPVDEEIFRAYSIVSSPYDEVLEFFSIVIPDGAFTSQLQYLQVGDELLLKTTAFGFLTLARYQQPAPKDLWLLATGTGVAPFLSMLQDPATWENYQHIILAYSARTFSELAYVDKIQSLAEDFGSLADNPAKFTFVPIVTRETEDDVKSIDNELFLKEFFKLPKALNKRIPELLKTGELQERVGESLDVSSTHAMLCGNPQMVEDTKETLKSLGLVMNRRGEGNIAVENYW